MQLLAWAAAGLVIASFQAQSGKDTIKFWVPSDLLMVAHFYLLSAPLLTLIALGSFGRNIFALKYSQKSLLVYVAIYTAIIAGACFLYFTTFMNIMALIGTCFFSGSVIFKDKFLYHRAFAMCHQSCWIFVFFHLGSYGGFTLIVFMFISNIIGMARYVANNKTDT